MSQESLNIIIGALIGFIPSTLIVIITHQLQKGEKNKDRERQIRENRINQVEIICNDIIQYYILIPYQKEIFLKGIPKKNSKR